MTQLLTLRAIDDHGRTVDERSILCDAALSDLNVAETAVVLVRAIRSGTPISPERLYARLVPNEPRTTNR